MSAMLLPTVLTADGRLSVFLADRIISVTPDHHAYDQIIQAKKVGDFEAMLAAIDSTQHVADYVSSSGKLQVKGGDVYYEGERLNNDAAKYLLELMNAGHEVGWFVNVMQRLMRNPSRTSIDAGFEFIFRRNWEQPMPILPDGRILGYKRVKDDYLDIHSGTVPYIPLHLKYPELADQPAELLKQRGHRIRMKRWQCDDDRRNVCSTGYHVGNFEYVKSFHRGEGHILAVAFAPEDIVCVPSDAYANKIRVCRLEVRQEISEAFVDRVFGGNLDAPTVWTPRSYTSDDTDWSDDAEYADADFIEDDNDED